MRVWTILSVLSVGAAASGEPRAALSSAEVDLGVIEQKNVVSVPLIVRNDGDAPFTIEKIQFSCHCLSVRALTENERVVTPGEKFDLPITYDPMEYTGPREATVMIATSDPKNRLLQARVKTTIVTPVVVAPRTFRWGERVRGTVIAAEIQLKPGVSGSKVELVDVAVPHPAIEFTYDVTHDGVEKRLDASFKIRPDAPLGALHSIVEATVRLDGRTFPIRIPLSLQVIGDMVVRPPQVVSVNRPSPPGDAISTLTVLPRVPNKAIRVLKVVATGGIRAVERSAKNETVVDLFVADDAAPGPHAGEIQIFSTSEDVPVASIPVYFNVGSAIAVHPSSLAIAPDGEAARSAELTVRMLSKSATISRVRTTVEEISARLEDGGDRAARNIVVEYNGSQGALPITGYVTIELSTGAAVNVPVVVREDTN